MIYDILNKQSAEIAAIKLELSNKPSLYQLIKKATNNFEDLNLKTRTNN